MDFKEDLREALKILREGGVILYPTDTVWGLGCDATSRHAVEKVFKIKQRKDSKSLILLVNGYAMLQRYVSNIPETAKELMEVTDKPLTIIYQEGMKLAPGVCNEDGSVGIRICMDDFCNELITRFRKPIISTSANLSGKPFPANFKEIDDKIIGSVDYVVKHRQNERGKNPPSSIIRAENNGTIKIIRE